VPVGSEVVRDSVLGVPLAAGELEEVFAEKIFFFRIIVDFYFIFYVK
jgi:hypothetical protein